MLLLAAFLALASFTSASLATSINVAGVATGTTALSLAVLSFATFASGLGPGTLGNLPIVGDGRPQAKAEGSLSALKLSASKGNKDAQYFLGNAFYYGGVGLATKDEDVAFDYFRSAALQGHLEAQTNLGVMLLNGYGKERETDARAGRSTHAREEERSCGREAKARSRDSLYPELKRTGLACSSCGCWKS